MWPVGETKGSFRLGRSRLALRGLWLPAATACGDAANRAAVANLDQALQPAFFAAALRKLGGAHFHGATRMSVTAAPRPAG